MKIVEIIVLMGTQCVSPVQHTPSMTEVSKVQCAVVIEKDSVTNIVEVSPPAAVTHPSVSQAMARLSKQSIPATASAPVSQPFRIVPAAIARRAAEAQILPPKPLEPGRIPDAAPEITPPAAIAPPAAIGLPPVAAPAAPVNTDVASLEPQPENPVVTEEATTERDAEPTAKVTPAKPKKAASAPKARGTKQKVAAKLPDRCSGSAVAKWYTSKNGHKKYRCVSSSSGSAKPRVAKAKKGLY